MAERVSALRPVVLATLLLLSPAPAMGQYPGSATPARQVIDAEALRAAGVRRLSEIPLLADDWAVTSVDGFTWRASPRGLASFDDQGWIVMVGDRRIELALFGVRSLDRLPITVTQIDSVEIISAPTLTFGGFASRGLIRFHLRRPARGLSLTGLVETADETGDPGPFRFTPLATPNIDRIGSGASAAVAYSDSAGFVELTGGWREHFATDPQIRERNTEITIGHHPIIVQSALAVRGGYDLGAAGRHRLLLGRTWTRDYFFLPAFGREVPAESPFSHLGIDGELDLTAGTGLRYRAAYESNALEEQPNALDLDFDWRTQRWSAALEARRSFAGALLRLGGGLERTGAKTGFPLDDRDAEVYDLYAGLAFGGGPRLDYSAAVSLLAGGEGDVALGGILTQRWWPARGQQLTASIAYTPRLPEQDDRIWLWQRRGYAFLAENGIDVSMEGEPCTTSLTSADVRWQFWPDPLLRLEVDAFVRAHSGLSIEEDDYGFDPRSATFMGPVRVVTDASGRTAGGALAVAWRPRLRGLWFRLRYSVEGAVAGDPTFRDAWRAVPRQRALLTSRFAPFPGTVLWAAVAYRGASRWVGYDGAAQESGGRYSARVDDSLSLDLAAQKWLWHQRLLLDLRARNILDDAVPHHPIGAAYGLTFQARLEARLGAR